MPINCRRKFYTPRISSWRSISQKNYPRKNIPLNSICLLHQSKQGVGCPTSVNLLYRFTFYKQEYYSDSFHIKKTSVWRVPQKNFLKRTTQYLVRYLRKLPTQTYLLTISEPILFSRRTLIRAFTIVSSSALFSRPSWSASKILKQTGKDKKSGWIFNSLKIPLTHTNINYCKP